MTAALSRIGAALTLFFAGMTGAWAYDTPEELVQAIYKPLLKGEMGAEDITWFSAETRAAWEAYLEEDPYGLGFSPIVDGQDFDLTAFEMGVAQTVDGRVEIAVRFENFGEPRELVYVLVDEPDGWAVDDIRSPGGEYPWSVREMLAQETAE
ncbi:hypothetical protein [Pelagibacterium halotolerans]|uniref:hypothetical protein n=1 Tax=Pelagibacterium halotolerans TaxID=531813 RepID=UPI00384C735F